MSSFPLMTLQPVADDRNAWSALMLDAMPPDRAAIAEVFDRFGLSAALGPLPCVLRLPDLAAVSDGLPASQIVLCLPAALCGDPAQTPALQALRAKGFRLMAAGLPAPGATLSAGVDALALDCPGSDVPAGLVAWLKQLPGPHMGIGVAEAGCPGSCHFQWRAGHATETVQHGAPHKTVDAPNRLLLLELLSKVANDADSHDIETTIKRDPQLSYYLLKLVNSVGFALTTKITSFNQAITLLGRRQLQRWLQLLLYARTRDGDKANSLLPRAALRAGLTEALCKSRGGSHDLQDRAFMAGMFSLLDQLFGMPIEEVVQPLNLAEDVQAALMRRTGTLGVLLNAVTAGEAMGAPAELAASLGAAGISNEDWARCLVSACHWAVQVSCEA
jgi:EAL and modified HD-GYP domain-containing signal transduction protein